MTFTGPFVLHTAQGIFTQDGVTVLENWVVTLKIDVGGSGGIATIALLPTFLNDVASAWTTFHANTAVAAGLNCRLTLITAAVVGTDGNYVGEGTQTTTEKTVAAAGTGTGNLPWATACVYTLRTAAFRGRASRGRFYYPATGKAIANDGKWTTGDGTGRATAAKTLLDAINAAANPELDLGAGVAVMSQLGGGTTRRCTAVAVGRIPDRQERREGNLAEDYSTAALA